MLKSPWVWLVAMALMAGAAIIPGWFWDGASADDLLHEAQTALLKGDWESAQRFAEICLSRHGDVPAALALVGQIAVEQQQPARAIEFYSRIDPQAPEAANALYWCGNLSIQLGRARDAEHYLRDALAIDPSHIEANNYLVFLLKVQGRNWELRPFMRQLMQQRQFAEAYLGPLAFTEFVFISDAEMGFIDVCKKAVPSDLLPQLGLARLAISRNQIAEAKELLLTIVAANPDVIEAQAQLGSALLESTADDEFIEWQSRLSEKAKQHPTIWFLWGRWARDHGQASAAQRCFWESVRRAPNHAAANYQLAQVLTETGQKSQADEVLKRFRMLAQLERLIRVSDQSQGHSAERMREIVSALELLGRPWEALAWSNLALTRYQGLDWARRSVERLSEKVDSETPLTLAQDAAALKIDLSHKPLPDWPNTNGHSGLVDSASDDCRVVFSDVASQVGLSFTFRNGARRDDDREHIYEFSGGGVSVLDYDSDGWPDLYLTQGMKSLGQRTQSPFIDRLFRNVDGNRVADITEQSFLSDGDYSGGAAVGDFDSDGFPDLYIANFGSNSFYRNNGDGSFSDVTIPTATAGGEWSLSSLLADFNGDSLPDLYVVNYLKGEDLLSRRCLQQGVVTQCPPSFFQTEQDRLYLNLGDGRFRDETESSGIVRPGGRGMGIVAADFDGSRRLSLYVANDGNANFLFKNESPASGLLKFSEQGTLRGLSFDQQGQTLGSMGIAMRDCDGDNRLDLVVTNFLAEVNNLYTQQGDGTFEDQGRRAGIHQSGRNRVSWGTQFLDGELDGNADLVIANGHLGRYAEALGQPSAMRTLYLSNRGDGRFQTVDPQRVGKYFGQSVLGRAIAVLDWNGDGLEDFCVTHVDSPVALLENRTPRPGHSIAIQLRGTSSNRDAIGTVVTIRIDDRQIVRQLTAGDGYQASNERSLLFGLADNEQVDELTVEWPSGLKQEFRSVSVNSELVIVEGNDYAFRRRRVN